MKRFTDLLEDARQQVPELMPWDLEEQLSSASAPFLLDVREPDEFRAMHIPGAVNIPRGILETACEWGFDDTHPALVQARQSPLVVICRSGNRSLLAAQTLQTLGYAQVSSLQTGVRGWNDSDFPLVNGEGEAVDGDAAEAYLSPKVGPEQMPPA